MIFFQPHLRIIFIQKQCLKGFFQKVSEVLVQRLQTLIKNTAPSYKKRKLTMNPVDLPSPRVSRRRAWKRFSILVMRTIFNVYVVVVFSCSSAELLASTPLSRCPRIRYLKFSKISILHHGFS